MCREVMCRTCGKTTWAGCGEHVADVQRGVPADLWCAGHEDASGGGLLAKLFGRKA